MPGSERFFDNARDVSVLLSPPWQSGRRRQLGRTICVQPSPGCSRSRSHSLERAVISLDGGVAAPRGDARCSLHAARASRIGAGGRGRGFSGDGAASRCRTAGEGEGRLRRSDRRRARSMESTGLRRDPDLERGPGLDAMAAHGAAKTRRAAHWRARAPRAGRRSGRRLAPRGLRRDRPAQRVRLAGSGHWTRPAMSFIRRGRRVAVRAWMDAAGRADVASRRCDQESLDAQHTRASFRASAPGSARA